VTRGGKQHIPRPVGWSPGAPNPWSGRVDDRSFALPEIERRLGRHGDALKLAASQGQGIDDVEFPVTPMRPPFLTATKDAAVLAPLFVDEFGETRVLLTRRDGGLRNHRGEVAFPGGRLDDGETPVQAALREAHEEVNLAPSAVRIIGQLEPLTTVVSASRITPFVGVVDAMQMLLPTLQPNPGEVDRIFSVTLRELTDPDCYREEIWNFPDGTFPVWFFEVEDDTIWGATGRMLRRLLDLTLL
jgi:8-oxo-dGTP pyrophosphatase MutT (NUDIX family)